MEIIKMDFYLIRMPRRENQSIDGRSIKKVDDPSGHHMDSDIYRNKFRLLSLLVGAEGGARGVTGTAELLATASDLGKMFGWSSGLALMYLPLWAVMFTAALMGFIGY
ncbi:NUCLEAR FUSION DEFECTIVE 4-like [Olea europaea subsp. europaea]|uniref:NUCLEAR FUSION DEFECTIVE 4-like n=1 Tax=Olea europaea subsp. europaea TaxID=158383 RepID=A0A8S0TYZ0_OLEEU|nr:NUCLEAR FUSION DEFECTIVE 4-like [Olea europaea subsp. europaea]